MSNYDILSLAGTAVAIADYMIRAKKINMLIIKV